jgi:hypothetical protein
VRQVLVGDTKGTKDADKTGYLERETFLRAEVERLRVELRTVEADAATEELAARKKKTKAEQEVPPPPLSLSLAPSFESTPMRAALGRIA